MKRSAALVAASLISLAAQPLHASDHLDGPVSSNDRVTDLVDLYAFPTPQTPGFLTIILDVYPVVAATGHFSDKVSYTMFVRRATIGSGDRPAIETSDEVAIRCSFVTPKDDAAHTATCKTDSGISVTVKNDQVLPSGSEEGLRLFAGHRSDPFFFNPVFAAAFSKGKLLTPRDQDIMQGANTLALVIDVELKKLFPNNPPQIVAISAESITQDSPDTPVRRLDRLGRPEITNILLAANDDDPDLRDQYNTDRPFTVPADNARMYRDRVVKNVALFDRADERSDWTNESRLALAELLVDDFLVVDMSLPCDQPSFLEIERSMLAGKKHLTCGGRKPADDVMDVIFTLCAGGLGGKLIRDGVDRPSQPPSNQFPYLAAPDVSASSTLKTNVLGKSGCGCRIVGNGETGAAATALLMLWLAATMRRKHRDTRSRNPMHTCMHIERNS